MKRFIALILASLFVFGLCACGAAKQESTEKPAESTKAADIDANFEKAKAFIESKVDLTGVEFNKDKQEESIYGYWSVENGKATALEDKITVDGQTVTIGKTTVADIKNLGFDFQTTEEAIEPNTITSVTAVKGDKNFWFDLQENTSDKPLPIDGCTVTGFNSGSPEFALQYDYMGIKNGMSFDEVITKLGMPGSQIKVETYSEFTSVLLCYYTEKTEGNTVFSKTLEINLSYSVENNSAEVSSMIFSTYSFTPEE